MNANVISLASGRPLAETEEVARQVAEDNKRQTIEANLAWLDKIREQVAAGTFTMPLMIAWSPSLQMFFTDWVAPAEGIPYGLAHAYVAQLEMTKLSMAEIAADMPLLAVDGTIMEPID
jgi:hypothetical protein